MFGMGEQADAYSWLTEAGHPDAKAAIFDENQRPKPAYFALLNVLKAKHAAYLAG